MTYGCGEAPRHGGVGCAKIYGHENLVWNVVRHGGGG